MSPPTPPQPFDPESLRLLPTEQLIIIILEQQRLLEQLSLEVAQLKVSLQLDSQTSSKPPSIDLLKKPEKAALQLENTAEEPKRRPGGQPGHEGKTRRGFGRVDRYYILHPEICLNCGSLEFSQQPVAIQVQQVAQLVKRPIEVVEYQQHICESRRCGQTHTAAWPQTIVPGHDIGVGTLQATNSRMFEAINPSVNQLREWVQMQPHVHVDETPWPVMGLKEWLWVNASVEFCLFHAADTRTRKPNWSNS